MNQTRSAGRISTRKVANRCVLAGCRSGGRGGHLTSLASELSDEARRRKRCVANRGLDRPPFAAVA